MGLPVLTWGALILVSLAFSVTSLAEEEEVTLGTDFLKMNSILNSLWCRYNLV